MLYYLIELVSSLLFFLSILIKNWRKKKKKELKAEDFPGGPEVKTSPSSARGAGSIHGWGVKIPRASSSQKTKT